MLEQGGRWFDPEWSDLLGDALETDGEPRGPVEAQPEHHGLLFDRIPKWIVRLHTNDGVVGVGESSRGERSSAIEAGVEALIGRDPRRLALHALALPREADYSTFEMAIFDLVGKAWGVPAYQLLGGARQERIAVDYWASRHAPENAARHAADAMERGFHGIKLKTALSSKWAHVAEDDPIAETTRAIRSAVGPDFTITIDPNYRFNDYQSSLQRAHELAPHGVLVLEDPFRWNEADLSDYARFRRESPVPVAMHVSTPTSIMAALSAGAVDYLNISANMADFVKMAWIAEQVGIHCWHGSGVDLGIRDASYLHAALAAANCTLPSDLCGNFLREDDLIVDQIPIEHGFATPPTTSGLGVELDESALMRYRVRESARVVSPS